MSADQVTFREATRDDVPTIVQMLAEDQLGSTREEPIDPIPESYYAAFHAISNDLNNELVVQELNGEIVGVCQLTFIPNMTMKGMWRMKIEGVRISAAHRGKRLGQKLMTYALNRGRERGCGLAQLTSNKKRLDAIRFYQSLGFEASHEGMKLML